MVFRQGAELVDDGTVFGHGGDTEDGEGRVQGKAPLIAGGARMQLRRSAGLGGGRK